MFGNSNATNSSSLPVPNALNYVEIALLVSLIAAGAPLNLVCFVRFLRQNCRRNQQSHKRCCRCFSAIPNLFRTHRQKSASHLKILTVHLLAANILILCVYGVGEVAWLGTYRYLGGDWICRIMSYFDAFCFYATSNLVAAIGLDRLYVAQHIDQPLASFERGLWARCIQLSPALAWTIAAVGAFPQLFVWRTFQPDPDQWPDWRQCVTVWKVQKFILHENDGKKFAEVMFYERLYEGFHLAMVFWIPAAVIAGSYALILCKFQKSITRVSRDSIKKVHRKTSSSSVRRLPTPTFASASVYGDATTPDISGALQSPVEKSHFILPLGEKLSSVITVIDSDISVNVSTLRERSHTSVNSTCSMAVMRLARAKRRTMKTSAWILLMYALCWSPYNISSLWCFMYPGMDNEYLELLANLIVLNAVVNPFIYGSS